LIDALPQVAAAIAAPLAKTERIVVISNGGDGQTGAGASRVAADITSIIAQIPATVEALTGVNLIETLKNLPGVVESPPAPPEPPAGEKGESVIIEQ